MSDLKFILGFLTGWIVTTEEGKQAANKVAETAITAVKTYANKKASGETPEKVSDK